MAPIRYNVFISFSGETSLAVAEALREWLPMVVQAAKPFMSKSDIEKGARGVAEIAKTLEGIKVGISCLTPDNLNSRWLHYEAGALSKTVDERTHLCTYLYNLKPEDIKLPLGMFQHTRADKEDTRRLVRTINKAISDEPIGEQPLDGVFDAMWPTLESKLGNLPPTGEGSAPKRTVEDMVAEILETSRAEANRRKKLEWMDEFEPVMRSFLLLLQREVWGSQRVPLASLGGRPREQEGSVEPGSPQGRVGDPSEPPDSVGGR